MFEASLEISLPPELPFTKVNALVVLGIGGNTRLLGSNRQAVIEEPRMRINAIAAKELASHGNLPDSAVIIPTGQGTELVDWHYKRLTSRQSVQPNPSENSYLTFRDLMGQPLDETELKRAASVSQGELMSRLIRRMVPKKAEVSAQIAQLIMEERVARNTILNFIEALNLLDEQTHGVWEGNMAVLTTNTGHLQRSLAIGRVLGLKDMLPISSEQTLIHYGYEKAYIDKMLTVSDSDLREQEKNLRALYEIPEFVIPELVYIKNDDRLRSVLVNVSKIYGSNALESFGIKEQDIPSLGADQLRAHIRSVGEERTRIAFDALSASDKIELGIDQYDRENDIDIIRKILASDIKATEKVRSALIAKFGAESEWFESNQLSDIITTEAYRIKNWMFGRRLPPNSWRDSANVALWRKQNEAYNTLTDAWIEKTSGSGNS